MKKKLIIICVIVWAICGAIFFFTSRTTKVVEIINEVEAQEIPTEERIWEILGGRGLTLLEKIDVMMVLRCESKYNQWAIGVNQNGSIDTGIAQWNSQAHPEVSRECSFDVECAINKMIDLYKKTGNLNQWVCSKVLK